MSKYACVANLLFGISVKKVFLFLLILYRKICLEYTESNCQHFNAIYNNNYKT